MIKQINGQQYYDLIDYGVRNLSIYKDQVNALNVFPVPDGDTGTNMLVTLQSGLSAIEEGGKSLSGVSKRFSRAVTFSARGNSGVIVSQFFKGLSETFFDLDTVDYSQFITALENGVKCAYLAVPNPVEGTVLTVVREAAEYVRGQLDGDSIHNFNDVIEIFVDRAKASLDNTPELLEVLKSAGVVDSGGAGIVYVFEGMAKYLNNEELPKADGTSASQKTEDFSKFNRDSVFEYGYCTELLLQLTNGKEVFDYDRFRKEISALGDSLVTAFDTDKVKVHIHTVTPENILVFCHKYGEFLSLKIENMSVQHQELYVEEEEETTPYGEGNPFSVVAVAHNVSMKKRFVEMGADHVITADYQQPPTAADFLSVFDLSVPKTILVFPNNKNTELAAIQAQRLCENAKVFVLGTRSDAECYAALPMIDFESDDIDELIQDVDAIIDNLDIVSMTKASKEVCFDGQMIQNGDYVATVDNRVLASGDSLESVAVNTITKVLSEKECEVITMFANGSVAEETQTAICEFVAANYCYTEIAVVETDDAFYQIVLSFE